ncbi:MAG: serine/threonine protein kinase [Myxococcales bacterium]|nr:serine/threonine protein kinase [Myxococcales bacterium]
MSTPPPPALRRYRIERYLTEGGMGAIYLGKRLGAGGFERPVVLKQLLPEFTSRPEFRDLFFREARISASLDHVNIVRTYDLVRSDDTLFIVMEYVRGTDLRTINWRARLRRRALSPAAILFIGQEILAGLAYMHGKADGQGKPLGIIHRDVSPSNILCSAQGEVKLSDFGIAKASAFASVFYRVRGKVGYMSPEQARSEPLDGRSDAFSLAVCLFESFLGSRLFVGDLQTPPEEVYARALPSLRQVVPGLPEDVEQVFARALCRQPNDRFRSAAEFHQTLRAVCHHHGLAYGAADLARELGQLLGPDPERWAHDDSAVSADTERLAVGEGHGHPGEALPIGKEATPFDSLDSLRETAARHAAVPRFASE